MNIKAYFIPLVTLILATLLSIHRVVLFLTRNIPTGPLSFPALFRLLTLIIIIFLLFDLTVIRKPKRAKKSKSFLLLKLNWPIVILTLYLLIQPFIIDLSRWESNAFTTLRYISLFGNYLVLMLMTNNRKAAIEVKSITLSFILFLGFLSLGQHPFLIAGSGHTILSAAISYRDGKSGSKTDGIFGAANEDANSMMVILPFLLLLIERFPSPWRQLARIFLITYILFTLLFNSTRTALFITFPIVLVLFYSRISIKHLFRLSLGVFVFLMPFYQNIYSFVMRAFASESLTEGTFGGRFSSLWMPAIEYTTQKSSLLGFGSTGWEHIFWEYVYQFKYLGRWVDHDLVDITSQTYPPHSVFVWVYVSWGLVGLALHLFFVFNMLHLSFKMSKSTQSDTCNLGRAIFCSSVAYLLWGGISNAFSDLGWCLLLSLGILCSCTYFIQTEKQGA